jgi:hypothetical protein
MLLKKNGLNCTDEKVIINGVRCALFETIKTDKDSDMKALMKKTDHRMLHLRCAHTVNCKFFATLCENTSNVLIYKQIESASN